jgi:hypothetical protein
MNRPDHFPTLRLTVAGVVSLVLLGWIGLVPGSLPPLLSQYGRSSPLAVLVTDSVASFIVITLLPILWQGPARDRWLALLLIVGPLLVVGLGTVWLVWFTRQPP